MFSMNFFFLFTFAKLHYKYVSVVKISKNLLTLYKRCHLTFIIMLTSEFYQVIQPWKEKLQFRVL